MSQGLLQPIVVRSIAKNDSELIAGQQRLYAHKYNDIKVIDAIVLDISELDAHLLHLSENLQRKDLNPLEEAMSIKALMDLRSLNVTQVASKLGLPRPTVSNMLRLLIADPYVLNLLSQQKISPSVVRTICDLPGDVQIELADKVINEGLNLRALEKLKAAFLNPTKAIPKLRNINGHLTSLEASTYPFRKCREVSGLPRCLPSLLGLKHLLKTVRAHLDLPDTHSLLILHK